MFYICFTQCAEMWLSFGDNFVQDSFLNGYSCTLPFVIFLHKTPCLNSLPPHTWNMKCVFYDLIAKRQYTIYCIFTITLTFYTSANQYLSALFPSLPVISSPSLKTQFYSAFFTYEWCAVPVRIALTILSWEPSPETVICCWHKEKESPKA